MRIEIVKKYIKLNHFFKDYCKIEYTSHIRHKMRGKDSAGNRLDFTNKEKQAIRKGWTNLKRDITDAIKD